MKKEVRLNYNLALCKRSDIDALLKLFETLIHATDGVLSGSMIWRNFYHRLNINIEKEILDAFGISSLEAVIHGIKSVVLYVNPSTYETFFMFHVYDEKEENIDTSIAAEAFARVYAMLISFQEKTGVKIEATITTDGASVSFPKDDPVEHDIVNNVFDSVRAVYKGLNNIKSETGVKTGVAITGLGIHFDSVKDKLGFSISAEKKELDNAADMRMPIKNTIDIAIKKVME